MFKKEEKILYRSRKYLDTFSHSKIKLNKNDMLGPPQTISRQGRLNPSGIPYMYTSLDELTAISESQPWIECKISIAKLVLNKDLRIADFTSNYKADPSIKNDVAFITWSGLISHIFSLPINPDDKRSYAPTQYIAELIKNNHFDGIQYNSSQNKHGINVVLFDKNNVAIVDIYDKYICEIKYQYDDHLDFERP